MNIENESQPIEFFKGTKRATQNLTTNRIYLSHSQCCINVKAFHVILENKICWTNVVFCCAWSENKYDQWTKYVKLQPKRGSEIVRDVSVDQVVSASKNERNKNILWTCLNGRMTICAGRYRPYIYIWTKE